MHLLFDQRGVQAVLFEQLFVRAELDDLTVVEHDYFVCVFDRAQAVGDDENCVAFQVFVDRLLDLKKNSTQV
jgi:hypothetical protein